MHLLVRFRVIESSAYEQMYHRKIRGRFDQILKGTPQDRHDSRDIAVTFSEPMPFQWEYDVGDEVHLLVAGRDPMALKRIAKDLKQNPELRAGSMQLEARAATPIEPDVGDPGTSGTITTGSGIVMSIDPLLDDNTDRPTTYWTDQEYTVDQFESALHKSVGFQLNREYGDEAPPLSTPLFSDYHLKKCFAVDVDVVPGEVVTLIASKWNFGYEVRDEDHRRLLNELLSAGVGAKRAYGFGMLQTAKGSGNSPPANDSSTEVTAGD